MKSLSARRSAPLVVVVLLVAIGLFEFGPTVAHKLFGPTPAGVKELSSIDQLQSDFNADQGSTRLVMIFSPT